MAQTKYFKATIVNFDDVSGWTDGPKKPTVTSKDEAKTALLTSIGNALDNVADGEVIQIIATAYMKDT